MMGTLLLNLDMLVLHGDASLGVGKNHPELLGTLALNLEMIDQGTDTKKISDTTLEELNKGLT